MEVFNRKQVRIYLGHEALTLAENEQKVSGKNFSQAIEDLILSGANKKKADNAKSKKGVSHVVI